MKAVRQHPVSITQQYFRDSFLKNYLKGLLLSELEYLWIEAISSCHPPSWCWSFTRKPGKQIWERLIPLSSRSTSSSMIKSGMTLIFLFTCPDIQLGKGSGEIAQRCLLLTWPTQLPPPYLPLPGLYQWLYKCVQNSELFLNQNKTRTMPVKLEQNSFCNGFMVTVREATFTKELKVLSRAILGKCRQLWSIT